MNFSNQGPGVSYGDSDKKKGKRRDKQENLTHYEKTHLLGFQFGDYNQPQERYRAPKAKTLSVREKKKLKQNYLQGNFRFFVNPDFDLDIRCSIDMDPNQEVKWDTIVKLKYITNNMIMCPICLSDHYDIKIAKITKCGHIFCWQCIIKYLSYQKPKCPLCEEIVVLDDLRSVQIVHFPVATPEDNVFFKLKKRRKVENTIYDAADFTEEEDFIRIKKIYYDTIKEIKEGEKKLLYDSLRELENDEDSDAKALVEKCIGFLQEEIQELEIKAPNWMPKINKKHSKEVPQDPANFNEDEFYYFYQDGNGLNIFLHPMDYKYMRLEYENIKNFPPFFEAQLLEMEGFHHNDQTRKRYKFLDHVPLNSDVKFAQVEMRQFLSTKVYEQLMEETDRHREHNKLKEIASKPHRKGSDKAYQGKQSEDFTTSFPPVQFNPAPSELKLDDKADYPELGPLNQKSHSTAAEPSWWTKELAPVPHNEKKYSVNKGQAVIKEPIKKPKEQDEEENYIAKGSAQSSLGDFIAFAQVKKGKKKNK